MTRVEEIFDKYFSDYKIRKNKPALRYVVTSRDRQGNALTNPHAKPGNAMDCTLRIGNEYAPITEYDKLLGDMIDNWPYRAGIDRTPHKTQGNFPGNVHVHSDLGEVKPSGQSLPFFFIEDNGVFVKAVKKISDIS